ncbi:kinetochore component CENP-S-domain-containing protein [Polychytrium aggregatum]|uniref:kinetochore component CENP-S-domain-containing protein n=1 Tax=Polychytrium aggregatum TaxID=110093 RepID=UPI0022FE2662|nr:kinetochore component CENP-S-domain-containing protein [Polychytrium aggregatum]KAI9206497.1 kinetochore component CENP-S-domain-containing protein [Polychytrium aggregatum]
MSSDSEEDGGPSELSSELDEAPEDTSEQTLRLKAAVYFVISKQCEKLAREHNVDITPQFIRAVSELVYQQAGHMGTDLELFAKHAKRSTIAVDDVKLCVRRNEHALDAIAGLVETLKQGKARPNKRPRE